MLIEPRKYGVKKDKEIPRLDSFKLTVTDIMIGNTEAVQYKWIDKDGNPVAKFTTFEHWDGKNICDLKVYTKYRKRGYSYQLLDYATKRLRCKALAVRKENEIAKHTYSKYGFRVVDQDDKYYYMYK